MAGQYSSAKLHSVGLPEHVRHVQDASAQRKQRKKEKKKKKAGKGGQAAGGDEGAEDAASQSADEDGGPADFSASPEPGSPTNDPAPAKQGLGPDVHPDSSESDQAAEPASDHRHRPPAEPVSAVQASPGRSVPGESNHRRLARLLL